MTKIGGWTGAIALGVMGMAASGQCQEDRHQVGVTLQVVEQFGMTLDKTSVDLGVVRAGEESASQDKINIHARSNKGSAWAITLQGRPLTHADGNARIPFRNFTYNLAQNSGFSASNQQVPLLPRTIYLASEGQYDADLGLGFKVAVPAGQKTGSYSTTLNLNMVDSF